MELSKGKLSRVITKRGQKISTYIIFEDRSLSLLLEGVEDCCKKESLKEFKNSKVER